MTSREYLRAAAAAVLFVMAVMLFITLVGALLAPLAHGAALLDMDGRKIVVLTGDEFVATMKQRDDEIARLQLELARVRKGCPET